MSEVDKPFDIPSHWEWRRLDQVGEVHSGSTPSTKEDDNFGGEIPWLTPGDLSEYEGKYASRGERNLTQKGLESCSAKLLPEGSILFSSRAPIGYTVITQNPISTNQGFKNLVPGESIDEDYAYHYLKGSTGLAKSYASGTTFSELSATRFAQIPIPLPPLPEQRRIVAKIEELFSNLDAGMADLQVAGQQLERYRLSVLQAAVEGRLTADWRRTHDPKPADQLLERILEKRRERWEEDYRTKRYDSKGKTPPDGWKDRYSEPDPVDSSDLPSLPSSWKWVRFEQISLLDSGYAFSSDKFTDEGMPLLRGANVAPGHLKWGDTEYWPEDEVGSYEHLIVEEGDIILAMDRPLINAGLKIARAEESDTPCLLVQRVARFKPVFESLTAFLYLTCSTQRFIAHLREGQTGTQIPHVSKKSLRAYPVPLPPLDEQKQIVDEVERLLSVADDAAATAGRENTRAERLRQSILKQAFSGRLVPHDEDAALQVGGSVSESADSDSSEGADGDVEDLFGSIDPSKQIEMDL